MKAEYTIGKCRHAGEVSAEMRKIMKANSAALERLLAVPLNKRHSSEIRASVREWSADELMVEIRNYPDNGQRRLHEKWLPIAMEEATRRGLSTP